jgi:hypothetical protein
MVTTIAIGALEATLSIGPRGETRQAILDNSAPLTVPTSLPTPVLPASAYRPNRLALPPPPRAPLAIEEVSRRPGSPYLIRREDIFSPRPSSTSSAAEAAAVAPSPPPRYSRNRVDPRVAFCDMLAELGERNMNSYS